MLRYILLLLFSTGLFISKPLAHAQLYIEQRPLNASDATLNLWGLEKTKFFRSPALISPNGQIMIYSEITFMPHNRQTFSVLYQAPVGPIPTVLQLKPQPPLQRHWWRRDVPPPPQVDTAAYYRPYDPQQQLQKRSILYQVGRDESSRYRFQTLLPLGFSADGSRLLVRIQSGLLHMGVQATDALVIDLATRQGRIYSEIRRVPERAAAYPLGWLLGSSDIIVFETPNGQRHGYDIAQEAMVTVAEHALVENAGSRVSPITQPVIIEPSAKGKR